MITVVDVNFHINKPQLYLVMMLTVYAWVPKLYYKVLDNYDRRDFIRYLDVLYNIRNPGKKNGML